LIEPILKIISHPKNRIFLIFSVIFILAIQALFSIVFNSVNFPISDDWPSIFAGMYVQQNDPSWMDAISSTGNEHQQYFYRLVMMVGFLLNSFNVQQFMFLNWSLLLISIGIFYMILKKADEKLTWLCIPFSAFIFSPKMISTNLTASIGLAWIGLFFYFVLIVGILNKQRLSNFWLAIAICMSIAATFTVVLGLLTWVVGAVFLILRFKENKKNLIVWIIVAIIIFSFYLPSMDNQPGKSGMTEIVSLSGLTWGLEYVSNPFSVKFLEIRVLIGILSIFSLVVISLYLLKKQIKSSYPWIMFGVIGILSTILTDIGRFGVRFPYENYFIIMSLFTQIGLLGVTTILYFEITKSNNKKKFIKIIYIIFITSQMILLIPSYLTGIEYVENSANFKSYGLSCFDLPSNLDACDNWNVFGDPKKQYRTLEDISHLFNILIEKKISIFSDDNFFLNQEQKMIDLDVKWSKLDEGFGIGQIEIINDQNISNLSSIDLYDNHVRISGWFMADDEIDEVYLFIDGKTFLSSSNFKPEINVVEKLDIPTKHKITWDITFLSGFI